MSAISSKNSTFVYRDTFQSVSPSFCRILGRTPDSLVGVTLSEIFLAGVHELIIARIDESRKTREPFAAKADVVTSLGTHISIEFEFEFAEDGTAFGVCRTENNSTDDNSPFLLNLKDANGSFPAMLLVDPESMLVVDANASAAELYGYRLSEFIDMPLSNVSILPQNILVQEMKLARDGLKTYFISRHRTAEGLIKDVSIRTSTVDLRGKLYVFEFIQDITRRKRLEKVIEEKNRMLAELNVSLSKMVQEEVEERKRKEQLFIQQSRVIAMGEMIDAISHYWRMPLNTIGVLVQDIEDANNFGELNAKYLEEMVRKVMKYLNTISHSIDDFMAFFRPSADKALFDVRAVIDSVAELVSAKFVYHYITVSVDCECKDDCDKTNPENIENNSCKKGQLIVNGMLNEFKQVVLNIFINSQEAIAVSREKGVLNTDDEGLIIVKIKCDGPYIEIAFEDNGGGLDGSVVVKAFEPYFTTKQSGSGIGLYMVKSFVENTMHGTASIENISDGCRITLKIPRYRG